MVDFHGRNPAAGADAAAFGAEVRTGVPVRHITQDAGEVTVAADGDPLASTGW